MSDTQPLTTLMRFVHAFHVSFAGLSLSNKSIGSSQLYTGNRSRGFKLPWLLHSPQTVTIGRHVQRRGASHFGRRHVSPALGLPASYVLSQGGYFDITLDPDFADNQRIYLSFAYGTPEQNGTRIVSGTLEGNRQKCNANFHGFALKDTAVHYGGKMLFLPDDTLVMTTGDGFEYREAAGHLQPDGQDHPYQQRRHSDDNPYVSNGLGNAAVWSYGHRNPQGLVLDETTGRLYSHEHGAKGGDELNLIKPAANYGWPAVTMGIYYSGAYVSPLRSAPGIVEPLTYWDQVSEHPDWPFMGRCVPRLARQTVYWGAG